MYCHNSLSDAQLYTFSVFGRFDSRNVPVFYFRYINIIFILSLLFKELFKNQFLGEPGTADESNDESLQLSCTVYQLSPAC